MTLEEKMKLAEENAKRFPQPTMHLRWKDWDELTIEEQGACSAILRARPGEWTAERECVLQQQWTDGTWRTVQTI